MAVQKKSNKTHHMRKMKSTVVVVVVVKAEAGNTVTEREVEAGKTEIALLAQVADTANPDCSVGAMALVADMKAWSLNTAQTAGGSMKKARHCLEDAT